MGVKTVPNRIIIETQLDFYRSGKAGCLFAAHAAQDPQKYGWHFSVAPNEIDAIVEVTTHAIANEAITTQSIILPSVLTPTELAELIRALERTPPFSIEFSQKFRRVICVGLRVQVGNDSSWVAGFGNFGFFAKTRRAVFTELTFRVKKRPTYDFVMKEAPPDTLHVADMDLLGISENKFKALWYGTFDNTEKVLGHKPDLRSAAKTTFVVPRKIWNASER